MSKAVKAVTKAVKGVGNIVTGGLFGGSGSSSPGMLGTGRFKGETRKIDKDAFKIKDIDRTQKEVRDNLTESKGRSRFAQDTRRGLITDLQAQAAGTAPSLAEAQLRSAMDRNLSQQLAAAQAQRGGNVAATQRQLMQQQAQAGRETAQDAATARLQERESAQQLLGQQIGQEQQLADQLVQNYIAQGFNIEQARQKAAQAYEKAVTAQFLQAQGLTAQGFEGAAARRSELGPQMFQGLSSVLGLFSGSDKNIKKKVKKTSPKDMMKAISDEEKKYKMSKDVKSASKKLFKTADKSTDDKIKEKTKNKSESKDEKKETTPEDRRKRIGSALSGMSKAGKRAAEKSRAAVSRAAPGTSFSSLMSELSDKRTKKDMSSYSDERIKKDFLDKLEAYTYEYKDEYKKDPRAGEGRHMSVMAQDLEKAGPLGSAMVQEDENGVKMVDYAKGYGAILAAQANLNKRLDALEKRKSKKRK